VNARGLPGTLHVAPLAHETTWSLLSRVAERYALDVNELRTCWDWDNQPPRIPGAAGVRPDAEILLNQSGRQVLARLCRTDPVHLAWALPSWNSAPGLFGADDQDPRPLARWQVGSTVGGAVAHACRPCTLRRAGHYASAMRYRHGWQRVCQRHRQWALNAADHHGLQYLDLSHCPEIMAAQRRWAAVARRARREGAQPGRVFALAQAVVCQWWDQALEWEQERAWPARLHLLAGGDAGQEFWWWRAVTREAATFPEVVTVAAAVLDPAMRDLVWVDSGRERIRPIPPDGAFCRELGRRLGRPWFGEEAAANSSRSLLAWMGSVLRERRGISESGPWERDPWWVRREDQPVSVALQLRRLAERADGTITWRSSVPRPERAWIHDKICAATELLTSLDLDDAGHLAAATQQLLSTINETIDTLDEAAVGIVSAAHTGGVPLGDLSMWTCIPADDLQQDIDGHREFFDERYG